MKQRYDARSLTLCSAGLLVAMLGACASTPPPRAASDASSKAGSSRDAHYLAQLDENRFQTNTRNELILALYEARIAEAPADAGSFRQAELEGLQHRLEDSLNEHEDRAYEILQNWIPADK